MVPRTNVKFTASRKNELKKTACNPKEKTLNFKEFYELAEGMATEKGPVILYLSKKESLLNGVTYKVGARVRKPIKATKTAKADAAKASQSKLVTWMENTMKPMLDEIELYSTQVQRALIDVTNRMATQQVMLDDEFLASLKVLAEAPPAAPERKCPPPPMAFPQPSAGVSDIPPPIETKKQPANVMSLQAELTASLDRIYDDMRSRGETIRPLLDARGQVVAQLSIRSRQTGTSIYLDEAGAGYCPQGDGLIMGATSKRLYLRKVEFSSLEEAKAVSQATHWLELARRFESEVAIRQSNAFALSTTMNQLLPKMEKNGLQKLELRDDQGHLVAVASVCRNNEAMRLLVYIDEPVSGEWAGPGSQGVSVHAGSQLLKWYGKGPMGEAENERAARFLKLAQAFDAQILAGSQAQPVTVQAKSSEALNTRKALAQQLALVYDHLMESNQHWEWLLDEKGQQVAHVSLEHDQMPPRIVVMAPHGIDSTAPQKVAIAMDMLNKEVYFLEPSSAMPGHFDPWLKLVKGYAFGAAPAAAVRTIRQNDQPTDQAVTPAALTAALHSLSQAMSLNQAINDANRHLIWLDKKGNVRFDEVIGAELAASAEFVTKSNGDRILTVQSAYAYEQQGQKGMWGSVLSPNNGTNPPGLRLNTKADYDSAFNASEIQTKVGGLMEFTQKFQNALDALAKVQNAV